MIETCGLCLLFRLRLCLILVMVRLQLMLSYIYIVARLFYFECVHSTPVIQCQWQQGPLLNVHVKHTGPPGGGRWV